MSRKKLKHCSAWASDAEERREVAKEAERWLSAPKPLDEVCHKHPRWMGSQCGEVTT